MHPFISACGGFTLINGALFGVLSLTGVDDEVYDWLEQNPAVGVVITIFYFTAHMILVHSKEQAAKIEFDSRFKGTRRRRR